MILPDANLFIYAYNADAPHHENAKAWLGETLASPEVVGLPWSVVLAFLRIMTNQRIFPQPLAMGEAEEIVDSWWRLPSVTILEPGPRHWAILRRVLEEGQVHGPMVTDAHLAALAIEHGATLCSTDRDFARFPELDWRNPLAVV